MFNRRQEREQFEQLQQTLDTVSPYIEIARRVADDVAQAQEELTRDMEGTMGRIITNLTSDAFREVVDAQFQKLPADERAQMLLKVFPDEALQEALADERRMVIARQGIRDQIERIASLGHETQHVDLRTVPLGTIVSLTLYDVADYAATEDWQTLIDEYPAARFLRGSVAEEGKLHILEDGIIDEDYYSNTIPYIKPHSLRSIGHTASGIIEPVLYYGAPVEVDKKKAVTELQVTDHDDQPVDIVLASLQLNTTEVFNY